jgi:hypothetical protein
VRLSVIAKIPWFSGLLPRISGLEREKSSR